MGEYDNLVSEGMNEDDLYDLHCLFIMAKGKALGLVESTLPAINAKGCRVLAEAIERGWKPDWEVTASFLESNYADGGKLPRSTRRLIKKMNEFRP